jgi:hypothetical protein
LRILCPLEVTQGELLRATYAQRGQRKSHLRHLLLSI